MDKEIKTKVDELMKNLGTRELSLDEMDMVSGGAKTAPVDFKVLGMTSQEAGYVLQGIVDAFGIDVAVKFANETWFESYHWKQYMWESRGHNEGYYAVNMIWGKIYEGGY